MIFQKIHEVIKNAVTIINIITDFFIFCLSPCVYLLPKTLLFGFPIFLLWADEGLFKKCVVHTK
jgi:hypothetical protein